MKRLLSILLTVCCVCLLFTGCSKTEGNGKAPSVDTNGLAVNEVVTGPINPLTGETVEADASSARPYCVMINNHPSARPCKGLANAGIVYEALVEGDITRMMAVFTDISEIDVGYIRSARPYYVSLVQAYDAIYVHCGHSKQARSDIKQYGVSDIDATFGEGGSAWVRDKDRVGRVSYEHTLYAKGDKIAEYAEKHFDTEHAEGYDTKYGLIFSHDAASQCDKESKEFTIKYISSTSTTMKYDAERKCYNAYISDKEYTDGNDTHIDFANVIILNVSNKVVDNKGHREMNLVGSGTGFFCTGGKYVEINWERADRNDSFHYNLTDGTPLALGVGKTFISIAPLDGSGSVTW